MAQDGYKSESLVHLYAGTIPGRSLPKRFKSITPFNTWHSDPTTNSQFNACTFDEMFAARRTLDAGQAQQRQRAGIAQEEVSARHRTLNTVLAEGRHSRGIGFCRGAEDRGKLSVYYNQREAGKRLERVIPTLRLPSVECAVAHKNTCITDFPLPRLPLCCACPASNVRRALLSGFHANGTRGFIYKLVFLFSTMKYQYTSPLRKESPTQGKRVSPPQERISPSPSSQPLNLLQETRQPINKEPSSIDTPA
uniref:Uncharacterized protein n=1 Tax=Timema tahoe TaxID=61484 RepID=A0A7R9IJW9_9NEOP|nr:unnamed protein product [Timema tahoe]